MFGSYFFFYCYGVMQVKFIQVEEWLDYCVFVL